MIRGHPHICLFEPEIPQNAGNVARLAAGTGCRLHLVKPFGFSTDDRNLKRPGLDYWPFLDLEVEEDFESLIKRFPAPYAFLSKKGAKSYTEIPLDTQLLVFGRETSGFPDWIHRNYADSTYRIPIYHPGVRSLNLANAVAIVVYNQLRRIYEKEG